MQEESRVSGSLEVVSERKELADASASANQSSGDGLEVKHHTVLLVAGQSPPLGGDVASHHPRFVHAHKVRNSNLRNNEQKPKIDFPPGTNPEWKVIERELATMLAAEFPHEFVRSRSIHDVVHEVDEWLYSYFANRFRLVKPKVHGERRPQRFHKGLAELRQRKKELKAARKALRRAGLLGTEADRVLSDQWFKLVRQHSKLRRAVQENEKKKQSTAAQRRFKKDPHAFASQLYSDRKTGVPSFSKEAAQDYFAKTYQDTERDHCYDPPDGLARPALPSSVFSCRCPTLAELRRSAMKKRNRASPGSNGLPYVIYKKCPSILELLHRIVQQVWKCQVVPRQWASAWITLLSKSEVLDQPSEFRPIAIAATAGKIFFSVVSERLQKFMVKNGYIQRGVQKGFLTRLSGAFFYFVRSSPRSKVWKETNCR